MIEERSDYEAVRPASSRVASRLLRRDRSLSEQLQATQCRNENCTPPESCSSMPSTSVGSRTEFAAQIRTPASVSRS